MSLASDYSSRMLGYGQTLSTEATTAINELEAVLTSESVTLRNGWLPGSKSNLATGARVLNLVDTADFVHSGTGTVHVGAGMMSLESDSACARCDR